MILMEEIQNVQMMPKSLLKRKCHGKSIHSPISCKNIYLKQLIRLLKRFGTTSNVFEGGESFREDILRLMLNLQDLLTANIGKAHDVQFEKWSLMTVYEMM